MFQNKLVLTVTYVRICAKLIVTLFTKSLFVDCILDESVFQHMHSIFSSFFTILKTRKIKMLKNVMLAKFREMRPVTYLKTFNVCA